MIIYRHIALATLCAVTLAGCTSGSSAPTCSFNDAPRYPPTPQATPQATPAASIWPKFRANVQNTGAVSNVSVSMDAQVQMMFPAVDQPAKGAFVASPVLNAGEGDIYIGSTDSNMYKISTANFVQDMTAPNGSSPFNLIVTDSITSTAVAALLNGQDAIFVGAGNGFLYAANNTGSPQTTNWPFGLSGFVGASPTMSLYDSTVYAGSQNGVFAGVCPNGVVRFSFSTTSVNSSPAIGPDNSVYVGSDDRQLRALQNSGALRWAFSAAGPIVAAPVVEVQGTDTFVYVADLSGRIFKLDAATGVPVMGFNFAPPVGGISSSPALANGHFYVGSEDGNLYAINTADGERVWSVSIGQPIVSSPAVAIANDQQANPVVVVGAMDGNLNFVEDDGSASPPHTSLALCPNALGGGKCDGTVCHGTLCDSNQPQPIESSPAISSDGTIYIGTDGGRVYAIQ